MKEIFIDEATDIRKLRKIDQDIILYGFGYISKREE